MERIKKEVTTMADEYGLVVEDIRATYRPPGNRSTTSTATGWALSISSISTRDG